ncbi:histidinol-phosphate transaminase [Candidatus Methylospira mobilis]|uniref:Histidinol-phosphate aminotransferase n=1 Tax=Candidatus Methylospira mobilis TaxID=1808979 RepID=A0A5Q0BM61_9GAMM|nr:histidinol-phosphate transaminase [Candidatus Methylospira mobilis]QFY44689.1 histidinol-phosphate transaminase [Candidatus Methylospira mobilis]WNV05772.1 histidinol-phosphate transaminase [Candidatus Methylospira mobilis]
MKELWSNSIRGLEPYSPGEQQAIDRLIKLNTNENPYPPSAAVLSALRDAVNADLRLYPDPEGKALKQTIADMHGLDPANVFVGNGSDEVLAHAFFALLKHELPILFPDVSYSFYPVYCALYGIKYETVPLDDNFRVNVADYARPNGGIVLPNPNAPTGMALRPDQFRSLLERCRNSVVAVDEAYVDFGADSLVPLVKEFPNLLVVQTLSKSRSLAGLRVGFAIGDANLIAALDLVKGCFNSYPLDRLALAGAVAALRDREYFETTRAQVVESREWLAKELSMLGFQVLPSSANFIFARHPLHDALEVQQQLREKKILVRHFTQQRIAGFLRISVGTDEECRRLVEAMRGILRDSGSRP